MDFQPLLLGEVSVNLSLRVIRSDHQDGTQQLATHQEASG